MRPLEKINLLRNIKHSLDEYPDSEKIIFLDYAGIGYEYWNQDICFDDQLARSTDEQLSVLMQELGMSPNLATLVKNYPRNWETNENLKAFISHSTNQKKSAHNLKESLKLYKIDCFVAHDDINPSEKWESEIIKALNTMDIFISIITDDFNESIWCQQEAGFAIARNVDIINIRFPEKDKTSHYLPKGFLSFIQGEIAKHADQMAQSIANTTRNSKKIGELYNQINPISNNSDMDDEIPF